MPGKPGIHDCVVCRDPRLPEIEVARAEGLPYQAMAGRFWVAEGTLRYHFKRVAALTEGEGGGGALRPEPGAQP